MLHGIDAVQIRVTLDEIKPRIWRRLVVPAHWTLAQLHLVIQGAFGWWNGHLHEYQIGGLRFGDVGLLTDGLFEDEPQVFDSGSVRLRDFEPSAFFRYIYDFGDNWRHSIAMETTIPSAGVRKQAICVGGQRARPPEDVGGSSGYERFLAIIGDKSHEEHNETMKWCGGHFDPEWFDLAVINRDISNSLRPGARHRRYQPKPKSG